MESLAFVGSLDWTVDGRRYICPEHYGPLEDRKWNLHHGTGSNIVCVKFSI